MDFLASPPSSSLLHVVVELWWSNDLESSAGGSVATSRVSHAKEVEGNDHYKQGYTGLPGWGGGGVCC